MCLLFIGIYPAPLNVSRDLAAPRKSKQKNPQPRTAANIFMQHPPFKSARENTSRRDEALHDNVYQDAAKMAKRGYDICRA